MTMKRVISWMLAILMLVSCGAVIAIPAAATGELVNLYNDATDGYTARADSKADNSNKGFSTPYLVANKEYITTEPITVAAGDVLYFGPSNAGQGYQLYFYPTSGTPAMVGGSACREVFSFESTLITTSSAGVANKKIVMYAYTATAAGQVRITFPQEYHDVFMVTKNQPVTYEQFYAEIDSGENNNYWKRFIDPKNLVGADGKLGTNPNHYATHYIPVTEGDTITWGPHPNGMYLGAVGYNSEKEGVTGHLYTGSVATHPISAGVTKVEDFTEDNMPNSLKGGEGYGIYSYEVPAGVSYVRVALRKEASPYFQVQKNNVFDVEEYWELMGGDMNNRYFGKTALWLGDSIGAAAHDLTMHGLNGWAGRVSHTLNMKWVNNSKGGWSLSNGRLDSEYSRIVGRLFDGLASEPADGYGVVMLHGGTNDAWSAAPVGAMSKSFYPGDFDVDTYAGGLEELFYYATTLYGDTAEINYILNFKMTGRTNANDVHRMDAHYAEALKICKKWGVTPIDLYHDDAVTEAMASTTFKCFEDLVHPSYRGYEILAPIIVEKMYAATTQNTWDEDQALVLGKINAGLRTGILADQHFTNESKANVLSAAKSGTNRERVNAILAAAPSLKQKEDNYISIMDLTKYEFMDPKDFAVSNTKELAAVAHYTNIIGYLDPEDTVHQTADITMSGTQYPIGIGQPFVANYDGHGHQIIGVKLTETSTESVTNEAFFPVIKNATVKNLTLKNANITGKNWASVLVGQASGPDNLVENCHVVDSILTNEAGNGMSFILMQAKDRGAASTDGFRIVGCTVSGCTLNINNASGNATNVGLISARVFTDNQVIEECYVYNNTVNIKNNVKVMALADFVSEGKNGKVINCGSYNTVVNNQGGGTIDPTMHSSIVGYVMSGTFTITGCYSDSALPMACVTGGKANITNSFSVGAGTTTVAEITGTQLAAKLEEATGDRWLATSADENLTLPMVQNIVISLGGNKVVIGEDGKAKLSAETLAALSGKIWRKGNVTLLTKDFLNGVYQPDESWVEADYLLGDCMGGNSLDTRDALALLQNVIGMDVDGFMDERADMNGDGKASIADVCIVLRYIAEGKNAA